MMDFYKRMSDGELLAFHRQAQENVRTGNDPVGGMADELRKIEGEIRERGLETEGIGPASKRLRFFIDQMTQE